jgi:hypothetical protein
MNRFRTKKRAKEAPEGPVRASTESENPSPPNIKSSKTFRLGKKSQQPEAKLELDLTNALPPSDDFRTSLLMSGLSARFSMLREQDDPLSKIGKASDDSVLFPPTKRQSRLNDLAFQPHGLSDIAEVSSINGSARPWAVTRTDSYKTVESNGTDEDSVHSGGIMSRPKPGEGNILFGGRQKIYKIPVGGAGSTKSLTDGAGSGGMGGRAMYESDISQSTFQKLREVEKAQQQEEEHDEEDHSVRSPSPTYNRNRETSSTTSSAGPSTTRISTAATSVTSQRAPSVAGSTTPITPTSTGPPGAERPANKGRRLYDTGLDQHLHEQQFSAMSRLDNLTRQRALGAQTPPLGRNSPTLASHPAERWNGSQITGKASMPNMRTASPSPVPGMRPFDFPSRQPVQESKLGFGVPPLSPPVSENDDHLIRAVQPNDRGKATALGAFAKPAQPYDENKYSQRQIQMQQGRETPPLRKNSPPRAFAPRQQQQVGRTRADSNATYSSARSRSNSSAQGHFLPPDRITETGLKSKASVPSDSTVSSARASSNGDLPGQPAEQGEQSRPNLQHIRDLANLYRQNQNLPLERPPESQHPANRQHSDSSPASEQSQTTAKDSHSTPEVAPTPSVTVSDVPADSPTLGPTTEMTGLSGMVRQHLRSDSNTSSIYGGMPPSAFNSHEDEPMPQNEYTLGKHPAAGDDWDHSDDAEIKSSLDLSVNSSNNDNVLPPQLSMRSVSGETTGTQERSSWEKELSIHHTRDGSTETQKEREDFRNDLAARRRRVQENLKSFVETESRSSSPLPGADLLRDVGHKANPLGLLKSKSSRGSLMGKPKDFRPTKAPANGPSVRRSTSPARATIGEDPWREEDEQVLQDGPKIAPGPPPNKAYLQARRDAQRDRERLIAMRHPQQQQQQQPRATPSPIGPERMNRSVEDLHYRPGHRDPSLDRGQLNMRPRHQTPSRERKPPPVAYAHRNGNPRESQGSVDTNHSTSRPGSRQSRDRSGSDASQRSKSRNGGRYPDVVAKPAAEGAPSPNMGTLDEFEPQPPRHLPHSPHVNGLPSQASPVPSPLNGSEPRMESRNRSRSNSRSTPPGYFDRRGLPPLQTDEAKEPALAPRPPITSPMSGSSSPNLPQPSPMSSVANTPTTPGFQSQGTVPAHRKRSINKSDISEPRFVSSTSRVTTVNLPPGASLQNGIDAPPIPPVNPRRKVRPVFGFGRKEDQSDYPVQPAGFSPTEDRTTFSDDGDSKSKPQRQKLRKISSEGGNLNAKARQAIFAQPSPVMPDHSPIMANTPVESVEGGMF